MMKNIKQKTLKKKIRKSKTIKLKMKKQNTIKRKRKVKQMTMKKEIEKIEVRENPYNFKLKFILLKRITFVCESDYS